MPPSSASVPPSSSNANISDSMLKFMDLTPEMIFQLAIFTLTGGWSELASVNWLVIPVFGVPGETLLKEAKKLLTPQLSQSYTQVAKSLTASTTTQTDEIITKIVCPPLKLLQPLISIPKPTIFSKIPAVTIPSTSTQAHLLPPTSSATATSSVSQPLISLLSTASSASNSHCTSVTSS
ncbi:hypothetical protein TNCV_1673301 [Trichonephila clavipes]|nr:hypothetical protein TNCV_1673301 [Trichonephila clavipes]